MTLRVETENCFCVRFISDDIMSVFAGRKPCVARSCWSAAIAASWVNIKNRPPFYNCRSLRKTPANRLTIGANALEPRSEGVARSRSVSHND